MSSGIINAASRGEYKDPSNYTWVYFQDSESPNVFYVLPTPQIAVKQGYPQFHLTEYVDSQEQFVSALCQITTELIPPSAVVQSAIAKILEGKGVSDPTYQAMPFQDLGDGQRNQAYLNYANAAGTVSRTVNTTPSLSGNETAIFNITNMLQPEVQFFKDYFGGNEAAGIVNLVYQLTVIAHMDGITAEVSFDAQAAYEYQRTFKWVSGG
jgi:hypothetical protein